MRDELERAHVDLLQAVVPAAHARRGARRPSRRPGRQLNAGHQGSAKEGHDVDLFLAGDGVQLLRELINCECGEVVRGADDELVARAEEHIERDHPDLAGKLGREDILGMAEEESLLVSGVG